MNDFIASIILGIVEGLTEFIPVSSTGHLILAHHLLFGGEQMEGFWSTFEVVIQLGAILAVVVLYKDRFLSLFGFNRAAGEPFPAIRSLFLPESGMGLIHIAIAIAPAFLFGFLLHGTIKAHLFSPLTVIIGLVIGGVIMVWVAGRKIEHPSDSLDEVSYKQAAWIGIGQCLSLWPGVSRSGATIISGILTGLSQKTAAEFSFIVAVPVMIAATGYDFLKSYQYFNSENLMVLAVGFVVSFIVAVAAIKWFVSFLGKVGLGPFGWYRIIAGLAFWWIVL
ncbi:MAG: undecaprenyl-diphosphate phosphatase [Bacteroidetes bacterium]|nr:undecaprenyl-diphosphate phosphatase [Bacteroidota bacterium]